MKKVRIVRGAYGYQPKDDGKKKVRRTVPVMRGQTIEVSDAEAKRLVGMGVAAYVAETAEDHEKGAESSVPDPESGKETGGISLPPLPKVDLSGDVQ